MDRIRNFLILLIIGHDRTLVRGLLWRLTNDKSGHKLRLEVRDGRAAPARCETRVPCGCNGTHDAQYDAAEPSFIIRVNVDHLMRQGMWTPENVWLLVGKLYLDVMRDYVRHTPGADPLPPTAIAPRCTACIVRDLLYAVDWAGWDGTLTAYLEKQNIPLQVMVRTRRRRSVGASVDAAHGVEHIRDHGRVCRAAPPATFRHSVRERETHAEGGPMASGRRRATGEGCIPAFDPRPHESGPRERT
jgi:hypothetical protein